MTVDKLRGVCWSKYRKLAEDGIARKNEKGEQGEDRQVFVFTPSLASILAAMEERKGLPLTEAEVLQYRDDAPGVLFPLSVARKMGSYDDRLDPEHAYRDWHRIRYADFREKCYENLWGQPNLVYHEQIPLAPHIDVNLYPPNNDRSYCVLVTSGMSDCEMKIPKNISKDNSRIELVLYVKESKKAHIGLLQKIAHYPHDNETWFGSGHIMSKSALVDPLFEGSVLDSILFIPSIVSTDRQIKNKFKQKGWNFGLLHVIPITTAEYCHVKSHGPDSILDLFNKNDHPLILNESRTSYV